MPVTYPACTIRNTPSSFVHCVLWAKDFVFAGVAGSSDDAAPDVFGRVRLERSDAAVEALMQELFVEAIQRSLQNEELWAEQRRRPQPLADVAGAAEEAQSRTALHSLPAQLTLFRCALKRLLLRGATAFEKGDADAMQLV